MKLNNRHELFSSIFHSDQLSVHFISSILSPFTVFFCTTTSKLHIYNIKVYSCKKAKDLVVVFSRYALIE